jgi:hypothetical protein
MPDNYYASYEPMVDNYLNTYFDPEGSGYDYRSALLSGMLNSSYDKHWASRVPSGSKLGLLLKGKKHKTWDLLKQGEEKAGYEIQKKNNRYYSFPKEK